jgi:hypothetical protein
MEEQATLLQVNIEMLQAGEGDTTGGEWWRYKGSVLLLQGHSGHYEENPHMGQLVGGALFLRHRGAVDTMRKTLIGKPSSRPIVSCRRVMHQWRCPLSPTHGWLVSRRWLICYSDGSYLDAGN